MWRIWIRRWYFSNRLPRIRWKATLHYHGVSWSSSEDLWKSPPYIPCCFIYSDLLEDGQTVFICTPCLPVGVVVLDCGLLFGHKIIYLQIMHILSTPILFKLLLCLFLAYQLYSIPDNNKQQPTIIFKGNIFFHSRSVRDSCAFFLKKRVLVKKNKGSYDLKPQIEFLRRPSSIVCLIIVCSKVTY
jgi:hypothetical protein